MLRNQREARSDNAEESSDSIVDQFRHLVSVFTSSQAAASAGPASPGAGGHAPLLPLGGDSLAVPPLNMTLPQLADLGGYPPISNVAPAFPASGGLLAALPTQSYDLQNLLKIGNSFTPDQDGGVFVPPFDKDGPLIRGPGDTSGSDMVELTDLKSLLEKYKESLNKGVNLDNRAVYSLIIVYAIAIVVGFFGNILIVVAVLSRRRMRTARNVFIVTLAISDLILCVFTMPSTLWEVLYRKWPFGQDTEFLCRLANSGQATPMFMSSLAIMGIAADRFRCIMQPDKVQLTTKASCLISLGMVILAIVMSIPLFVGSKLKPYVNFKEAVDLHDLLVCIDERSGDMRLAYDVIRCFVQFVMPLLVVLGVYISIFCRLKERPLSQHSENNRRRRRTNIMIISVSVIFFLSWLPLNTLNFLLDSEVIRTDAAFNESNPIVYGVAHILGLGNACINPVLYGYLNENFRSEYKSLFRRMPWHNSTIVSSQTQEGGNEDGDGERGSSSEEENRALNPGRQETIPLSNLKSDPSTAETAMPGSRNGSNPEIASHQKSFLHLLTVAKREVEGRNDSKNKKDRNGILRNSLQAKNGALLEANGGVYCGEIKEQPNVKITYV